MHDQRGLTLVELMVTLVIVLLVIAAASRAYLKLVGGFKVQSRISDSQMDTLTGLELLRYDVAMAGYGLPYGLTITYTEATDANGTVFNDAPSGIPRAFVSANNDGPQGADDNNSDILVIKSTVASVNSASKKWSFLYKNDDNGTWRVKSWGNADMDLTGTGTVERVIVEDQNRILQTGSTGWSFVFLNDYYSDATSAPGLPCPSGTSQTSLIYGLFAADNATTPAGMPFNRVDYYLAKPNDADDFPRGCYPGSFILYRSTINHKGGARSPLPLIDCVLDFQVAFGLDTNDDEAVDRWQPEIGGLTAAQIRDQIREVRIFILYHEGHKDENYRFSGTLTLGDTQSGSLNTFTPAGEAQKYRWKVAKLVIKPLNLEE